MMKLLQIILVAFIAVLIFVFSVTQLLQKEKEIDSNCYIIESWGMPLLLESFIQKLHRSGEPEVFIVGMRYKKGNQAGTNNKGISYEYNPVENKLKLYELAHLALNANYIKHGSAIHNIRVHVSGRSAFGVEPLVYFRINDDLIWKWIPDSVQWLSIPLNASLHQLSMGFVNDVGYKKGDRMVFVHRICLDTTCYPVTDTTFEIVAGRERQNIFYDMFESDAQMASQYLQQLGTSLPGMHEISFPVEGRNQTLQAARACKNEIVSNHPDINAFTIVTADIHSRRSYHVYKKAFGSDFNIGVMPISYQNLNEGTKPLENLKIKLGESISLIVSWILPRWFCR